MKWTLKTLYSSPNDPQIERDIKAVEDAAQAFAKKYDSPTVPWTRELSALLQALKEYGDLLEIDRAKYMMYFYFLNDIESDNKVAPAKISLFEARLAKVKSSMDFFKIAIGKISKAEQKAILDDKRFRAYKTFLERTFDDASYNLTAAEENIMNLKAIPSYNMWLSGSEKALNLTPVHWKGKDISLAEALGKVGDLKKHADRAHLARALTESLKRNAIFAESEINAVVTNKKINDELRGYKSAYAWTVQQYRNDPKVVDELVSTVTDAFAIPQRFYKLKAKMLGLKKLSYCDRNAKVGHLKTKFDFKSTEKELLKVFGSVDKKYADIFSKFLKEDRIDALPRLGKRSGAYCWGNYKVPTHVLLNHTGDFNSYRTAAHEMGHAFHSELSQQQGPWYHNYSTSLAETASTLFEAMALEHVFDKLSDKEKLIALHDKISDDISTIFRQIACFNFEKEIHETVRTKGFISHEELADLHNKHMGSYLGPAFKFDRDDGYYFVHWSHLRRFFYVYSYAYGQLVSKAMLRRYKADPSFWKSIEKFLSAGGKDSPERILSEIDIDVSKPEFWQEGLKEVEDNIALLEKLLKKR